MVKVTFSKDGRVTKSDNFNTLEDGITDAHNWLMRYPVSFCRVEQGNGWLSILRDGKRIFLNTAKNSLELVCEK